MRARILLGLGVLSAVAAGAVATALDLVAFDVWHLHQLRYKVALIVGSAVFGVAPSVRAAVQRFREPRVERRREVAGLLCRALYWKLPTLTKIDALDLGVAAYQLRRRWARKPVLERVYRERARHRYNTSGVDWAPGKGVIGQAVSRQSFVALDVDAAWAPLVGCTEAEWNRQDDAVKLGLSHDEFLKLVGKHGAVAAMPIFDDSGDGQAIGCVAVDAPRGTAAALELPEVQAALGDAAAAIYNAVINPPTR